jgi:rhamnogalacturonyl hydrolase YesR
VARSNDDHVGAGRELIELNRRTGDPRFLAAARQLAALNASFPKSPSGARYHRTDTPGWRWQIWVDCMDVDGPFLAELARATGDDGYFDQAVEELLGYARALQHDCGLLYHGFERDCGQNGQLWARGNGWAMMGLVDALALLPRSHAAWAELHERLVRLVDALAPLQDRCGLWHTVVDNPDTYLESTLAAMAAYALHEGFAQGLFDRAVYGDVERRARAAMHAQIAADGTFRLVSDATPVGAVSTYATRTFGVFPWGQGPLLMALCQETE